MLPEPQYLFKPGRDTFRPGLSVSSEPAELRDRQSGSTACRVRPIL